MWILDNSVIIKWLFENEPLHQKALLVRKEVATKPNQFIIPTLCYSELIHVLSKKTNRDLVFVNQCLEILMTIGIRTQGLSHETLLTAAQLTCEGFSGYDATYLALAKELGGKWLTADLVAVKKDNHKHSVWLDHWDSN